MKYLYDLHCHTKEGSKCGASSVCDMVRYYAEQGFSGFFITDHFTGNSTVPESASWEERVNRIWEIYEEARPLADELGVLVFPAMEYSLRSSADEFLPVTGNDFVILGLTREWLLNNRDAFVLDFHVLSEKLHEAGAYIIHAHPYLEGSWIKSIILYPRDVDAVEVYNAHASAEVNAAAEFYANHYGLTRVAGSDNHCSGEPYIAGVETDKEYTSPEELIAALRAGKATPFMRKAR